MVTYSTSAGAVSDSVGVIIADGNEGSYCDAVFSCNNCLLCENNVCALNSLLDVCTNADITQEITTATTVLEDALSNIPVVNVVDPGVNVTLSGSSCSSCCNESVINPGKITFSGAITANATLEKTLSPVDFSDATDSFSFPFFDNDIFQFSYTAQLGPQIMVSPVLTLVAGGERDFCLNKNCFSLTGSATADVSGGAVATTAFSGWHCEGAGCDPQASDANKFFDAEISAEALVATKAYISASYNGCTQPIPVFSGCIGEITANVIAKIIVPGFGERNFSTPDFNFNVPGTTPGCGE